MMGDGKSEHMVAGTWEAKNGNKEPKRAPRAAVARGGSFGHFRRTPPRGSPRSA